MNLYFLIITHENTAVLYLCLGGGSRAEQSISVGHKARESLLYPGLRLLCTFEFGQVVWK